MDIYSNRLESFTGAKRAKGGPNSRTNQKNQKWPHPEFFQATPETLAEAGFYFDPSSEDKDSVSCYMCGKQLAEWAENDDPFEIHFKKCGKKCAWANVRCGLGTELNSDGRFIFADKNRLPTSKAMEKSRLDTFLFGNGWIHDQERSHGASSKKMAKAGFVYTPQEANDDTAVCLYCGISLSGWDAEDDPTEEHRKRVKKAGRPCPMFPDIVVAPPPSKPSKSHSRSKSKSSYVDVTVPMPSEDSDDNAFSRMGSVASSSTTKTPKASRTVKKGAKTPGSRTASKSRNIPVDDDDDDEGTEELEQAPPTSRARKPSTTARSRSISRTKSVASPVDSDAGTGTEDEVTLTRSTSTRSRGKSKDTGRGTDDESTITKKKTTKARSKSKTRISVIPENLSADEEPAPAPPKSTKKSVARKPSTRKLAVAKSASSVKDDDDNESDMPAPPRATKSTAKSKPISASVAAAASLFEDDDEHVEDKMEADGSETLTARPARATRKSTRPPPAQTQEDLRASTTRKRGTHSRTASTASRAGKPRAPSHVEEEVEGDDPLEDMRMHIPPTSTPSVEPEPELQHIRGQKAEELTGIERKPSKSKSKAKQKPPTQIQIDSLDQDGLNLPPPPIPPRSPSRPQTKSVPRLEPEPELDIEMEVDSEITPESDAETYISKSKPEPRRKQPLERKRITSDSKAETREMRLTAEASRTSTRPTRGDSSSIVTKPNPLLRSTTLVRNNSFLDSRSSTQSRGGVVDISSDEDDEDEVESVIRPVEPPIVHTKPKILTSAKPPRVKPKGQEAFTPTFASAPAPDVAEENMKSSSSSESSTSKPNSNIAQARPKSAVFEQGGVQAKIAQIEKTAEIEPEHGGRFSPSKPALANGFPAAPMNLHKDVIVDTAQEDRDHDVQMTDPSDSVEKEEQVKSLTEAEAKAEIPAFSRPAVTPPRPQPQPQHQPPASPFKTPFRFGPGNPFSVPPTPGAPMDLEALGVPIPLSKELFIPTRNLSDAELSMTVEEWVRYHKQIEYEKFKEDGERRIDAFMRHAEQTRRIIEGL